MIDSVEKLSLSCTFAMVQGKMTQMDDRTDVAGCSLTLNPGFIVDSKYQVVAPIGAGGMGAVYKVHHQLLQKNMALKTFATRNLSSDAWHRFQREAQAIARLRHKNIVEVFDFGIADANMPYYTMELLEGESLDERLKRLGPCDTELALILFIQVADAMAHAHRLQIVHRDIKPANIFLARPLSPSAPPVVKIVDFGIAKLATEGSVEGQSLTVAGTIFGSPLYMSPEQSVGLEADERSDIYSFGCALFQALTGKPPFVGENAFLTLMSHQTETPPALKDMTAAGQTSQRLDGILGRLLAKSPDKRYQTFEEVFDELTFCLNAQASQNVLGVSSTKRAAASTSRWNERHSFASDGKILAGACVAISILVPTIYFSMRSIKAAPPPQPKGEVVRLGVDVEQDKSFKVPPVGTLPLQHSEPFPVRLAGTGAAMTRTITFPEGHNGASIGIDGMKKMRACSGPLTFPAAAPLKVQCFEGMAPDFLSRFAPNALRCVGLAGLSQSDFEWTPEHLEGLSHLTGLKNLDLSKTDIDEKCLPYLDKLTNLEILRVSHSAISGKHLSRLSCFPKLKMLAANGTPDILQSLTSPNRPLGVECIWSCNNQLTDEDMKVLASFPKLIDLTIDDNQIGKKGLSYLDQLPKLKILSVSFMDIGPDSIETLGRFKHLTDLRISMDGWSKTDRERLQQLMPNCKITRTAKNRFEDRGR